MQHLHLAHRAVAGVHGYGSVVELQWQRRRARSAAAEREHVRLQRGQGAARSRIPVQVALGLLVVVERLEHALEVAPRAAERGQNRVALLEVLLLAINEPGAVAQRAQRFALGADLRPVLARRAEQEQVQLHALCHGREQAHVDGRQRRDPEHGDAPRNGRRQLVEPLPGREEPLGARRDVGGAKPLDQCAPELGLPAVAAAALPLRCTISGRKTAY